MSQFNKKIIAISVATALTSAVSYAQEAGAGDDNAEVIQVTGIRGALQRAQAIKMDETSIVEALSAEDIGKLPDTSVAESLSRLPGLAGERRNGRTSGLSVRGFNENYVGTSLNGRELLGMGDNRGVEYDLYPSEIVSNIVVYKTPEAGLLTQGIGGTVDLQTIKPLSADSTLTFNANYEKNGEDASNPDYDNDGHRFSFNYVDQFANDKLGVALSIASMETPRQENQYRAWGYANVNTASDRRATDTATAPDGTVVYGGHDSFARSALLERDSIAAVIQYAPTDDLMIQFDALYIDFEENDVKRGLEEGGPEWGTGAYTITGVEDGLVTSGYYDGFYSVIRNDARRQESELTTFGLNIEYQINENWTAVADISVGDVDKTIIDVESYSGVGRAGIDGRPETARAFQMTSSGIMFSDHPTIAPVDLTNPDLIRLAGPQAWGGSLTPIAAFQGVDGFPPNTAQDGFVNSPEFEESLDSIRLELKGAIEFSIFTGVELGINYSDRSKSKVNGGAYLTAPTWPSDGPIPEVLGVTSLAFIGIEGVLAYDSLGLYNSGYYTATDASLIENGRRGDSYTIDEEVTTLFAKLDIDTEIGSVMVKGNLGLQVVNVDQYAHGFSATTGPNGFTASVPVEGGDDYTDVLPTLNLSFEIAEDQYIRTAMAKVISRPRMDDMRPNSQVTFQFNDSNILSTDPENSAWSANSGNPLLKPLESNQFDLSYENYFADDGYFAATFFYKDLVNWHKSAATVMDFTEFYIPGFHQSSDETGNQAPATFLGGLSYREDGLTGSVRGWEFQTSLPFHIFSDSLDGLGLVAAVTFLDGNLNTNTDDDRIPGLSKENYSVTAYYEKAGFEFRVSATKRSSFLTETRGLSLSLAGATDQGATLVDAQIGYDFSESNIDWLHGLRVTLQGQNLTDEETIQTNDSGDSRQITQLQTFGANYLLGFNYSF